MPPRPSLNWIAIATGKLHAMRCTHASPATKGDAMTSVAQEDQDKGDAMTSAAQEDQDKGDAMTSAAQEDQDKGDAMTSAAQENQDRGDAMTSAAQEGQDRVDRIALPTRAVQGQEARDAAKRNNLQTDETLVPSINPRMGTSYHRLCGPKKLAAVAQAKRRWNHPKRISSHKLG